MIDGAFTILISVSPLVLDRAATDGPFEATAFLGVFAFMEAPITSTRQQDGGIIFVIDNMRAILHQGRPEEDPKKDGFGKKEGA